MRGKPEEKVKKYKELTRVWLPWTGMQFAATLLYRNGVARQVIYSQMGKSQTAPAAGTQPAAAAAGTQPAAAATGGGGGNWAAGAAAWARGATALQGSADAAADSKRAVGTVGPPTRPRRGGLYAANGPVEEAPTVEETARPAHDGAKETFPSDAERGAAQEAVRRAHLDSQQGQQQQQQQQQEEEAARQPRDAGGAEVKLLSQRLPVEMADTEGALRGGRPAAPAEDGGRGHDAARAAVRALLADDPSRQAASAVPTPAEM